jgi:hypothetical protein
VYCLLRNAYAPTRMAAATSMALGAPWFILPILLIRRRETKMARTPEKGASQKTEVESNVMPRMDCVASSTNDTLLTPAHVYGCKYIVCYSAIRGLLGLELDLYVDRVGDSETRELSDRPLVGVNVDEPPVDLEVPLVEGMRPLA